MLLQIHEQASAFLYTQKTLLLSFPGKLAYFRFQTSTLDSRMHTCYSARFDKRKARYEKRYSRHSLLEKSQCRYNQGPSLLIDFYCSHRKEDLRSEKKVYS